MSTSWYLRSAIFILLHISFVYGKSKSATTTNTAITTTTPAIIDNEVVKSKEKIEVSSTFVDTTGVLSVEQTNDNNSSEEEVAEITDPALISTRTDQIPTISISSTENDDSEENKTVPEHSTTLRTKFPVKRPLNRRTEDGDSIEVKKGTSTETQEKTTTATSEIVISTFTTPAESRIALQDTTTTIKMIKEPRTKKSKQKSKNVHFRKNPKRLKQNKKRLIKKKNRYFNKKHSRRQEETPPVDNTEDEDKDDKSKSNEEEEKDVTTPADEGQEQKKESEVEKDNSSPESEVTQPPPTKSKGSKNTKRFRLKRKKIKGNKWGNTLYENRHLDNETDHNGDDDPLSRKDGKHRTLLVDPPRYTMTANEREKNFREVNEFSAGDDEAFSKWTEYDKHNVWEISGQWEGDMLLTNEQKNVYDEVKTRAHTISQSIIIWPGNELPYAIDSRAGFTPSEIAYIKSVLLNFMSLTCLTVRPKKDSDKDFVVITDDKKGGCYSYLGKIGGPQIINLRSTSKSLEQGGCFYFGAILHVFMHAFGIIHEHSSPSRNEFIRININNVQAESKKFFKILNDTNLQALSGQYDPLSIMHYSKYAFNKESSQITVDPLGTTVIGQRSFLSHGDVWTLKKIYDCPIESDGAGQFDPPWRAIYRRLPQMNNELRVRATYDNLYDPQVNDPAPGLQFLIYKLRVFSKSRRMLMNRALMIDPLTDQERSRIDNWQIHDKQNLWEIGTALEGDIVYSQDDATNSKETFGYRSWPYRIIPYQIDENIINQQHNFIEDTIEMFNEVSCVKFHPRTIQDDFVKITANPRYPMYSFVGFIGGMQYLNVEKYIPGELFNKTFQAGMILHLLMHTLGFHHTHTSPNRDDYIHVNLSNILATHTHYFNVMPANEVTSFGLPYDYKSVMHVSAFAYSKNGLPTVTPKEKNVKLRHNGKLSVIDIMKINRMYNCPIKHQHPADFGSKTVSQNGNTTEIGNLHSSDPKKVQKIMREIYVGNSNERKEKQTTTRRSSRRFVLRYM